MRISDGSSDVCSSDLLPVDPHTAMGEAPALGRPDELVVIGAAVIGAEIAVNGEIAARGRAVAIDADQRIGDVMAHEGQARVAASRGQNRKSTRLNSSH